MPFQEDTGLVIDVHFSGWNDGNFCCGGLASLFFEGVSFGPVAAIAPAIHASLRCLEEMGCLLRFLFFLVFLRGGLLQFFQGPGDLPSVVLMKGGAHGLSVPQS